MHSVSYPYTNKANEDTWRYLLRYSRQLSCIEVFITCLLAFAANIRDTNSQEKDSQSGLDCTRLKHTFPYTHWHDAHWHGYVRFLFCLGPFVCSRYIFSHIASMYLHVASSSTTSHNRKMCCRRRNTYTRFGEDVNGGSDQIPFGASRTSEKGIATAKNTTNPG